MVEPLASHPIRLFVHAPPLVRAGVESAIAARTRRIVPTRPEGAEVVLVDIDHGPLLTAPPPASVVVLTRSSTEAARQRALECGAEVVLPCDISADDLVRTLLEVGTRVHRVSAAAAAPSRDLRDDPAVREFQLSAREVDVLELICQGLTNEEIAAQLYLSINSVKTYIRTLYRKIGVARRSQAVLWGLERVRW